MANDGCRKDTYKPHDRKKLRRESLRDRGVLTEPLLDHVGQDGDYEAVEKVLCSRGRKSATHLRRIADWESKS